jgi:crossover junction endodeoxyribonuclease RusA
MIVLMTPSLAFEVHGDPAPQGSKNAGVSRAGKGFVYEQNSKTQTNWRQDVVKFAVAAREAAGHETFDAPVSVIMLLRLRRPASVKISRRPYPAVKPDIDKITRNCLDALKQAGVYRDDAQVINLFVQKRYATDDVAGSPGATIRVELVPIPEII